jgi:hypothetical protein
MKFHVNQWVHTWLGWGHITDARCFGTSGNRYVVRYPNGMLESFHENQLSLD